MAQALIVVDVQNDFCPGGALAVAGGDEIVKPINALMQDAAAVVLTQDWHPADHTSFADNHEGVAPFSTVEFDYGPQVMWPRHCVQGSAGAAFHADLETDRAELIVRKGFRAEIDSYSAFMENDKTTTTGLAGYLRARGFNKLRFCGLATDFCVGWSALDAAQLGFDVTLDLRVSRAIDVDGSLEAILKKMHEAGITIEGNA